MRSLHAAKAFVERRVCASVSFGDFAPFGCCVAHGGGPRPQQFLQRREPPQRTVLQDRAESLA